MSWRVVCLHVEYRSWYPQCVSRLAGRIMLGSAHTCRTGPQAGVAQLVEHLICNQRVGGSNPFASSRFETLSAPRGVATKQARQVAELSERTDHSSSFPETILRGSRIVRRLRSVAGETEARLASGSLIAGLAMPGGRLAQQFV